MRDATLHDLVPEFRYFVHADFAATAYVKTLDEARDWCRARLEEHDYHCAIRDRWNRSRTVEWWSQRGRHE